MPYSETLEAERALIEERCEDKIANMQKHLKKFYSQELKVRAKSSGLSVHYSQAVSVPMVWFQYRHNLYNLQFSKRRSFYKCKEHPPI